MTYIPLNVNNIVKDYIPASVDGQGGVVSAGSYGFTTVPYAGTIVHWYVEGAASGNIQFDIKRSSTSIIGAGNKPLLSSTQRNDAAPSSWTSVVVAAGDELEIVVDSSPAPTVTRANLQLFITRS